MSEEEEKLKKFLASDDPEMVLMGLSLVKGSETISKEIVEITLGFYMFHNDSSARRVAKSIVQKSIYGIDVILKKHWAADYRNQSWIWEIDWMKKIISELQKIGISSFYLLKEAKRLWEAKTPEDWSATYYKKEEVLSKINHLISIHNDENKDT